MPKGTPYYTPSPNFSRMTAEELIQFTEQKIQWLTLKMKREWNYLEGRRLRQSHNRRGPTPTDDAYNADQPHEAELLAFLEHFKQSVMKASKEP